MLQRYIDRYLARSLNRKMAAIYRRDANLSRHNATRITLDGPVFWLEEAARYDQIASEYERAC